MKRENGFTLIELLTVIAILGILAAIIIPNVNHFLNHSTEAAVVERQEEYRVEGIIYMPIRHVSEVISENQTLEVYGDVRLMLGENYTFQYSKGQWHIYCLGSANHLEDK